MFVQLPLRKSIDRNVAIVCAIFGIWLLLVLISPYLVRPGQLTDLSGREFILDNQAKIAGINPIAWTIYTLGDINCHQLKSRSYFLNDNQMPFCTRDVGIFAGLFIGSIVVLLFSFSIRYRWLALGLVPIIIDGSLQSVTDYQSNNAMRMLTGLLAGAVVAMFICYAITKPTVMGETEDDSFTSPELKAK